MSRFIKSKLHAVAVACLLAANCAAIAQTTPSKSAVSQERAAAAKSIPIARTHIVLGQSAPMTGPSADLGIDMRDGALAYFGFVNKNGGVNGATIDLITYDDAYEPARAAANTSRFVQEGVFALFGYVGTPTSMAAKPIFDKAGLPFIAPFTGAESLRDGDPLIFNYRAGYTEETEAMVEHLVAFGVKNIAVMYQNDGYGKGGLAGVEKALAARDLKVAASGSIERNRSEADDVASAVKDIAASGPDAIIMVSTAKATAQFIKSYKAQAQRMPRFFSVSFVGSVALANAMAPADREGVVVSQVVPPFDNPMIPVVREYQARMREMKPDAKLSFTSLEGFIAAKMFVEGLKRAGAQPTRESLVKAFETFHYLDLGEVYCSFDKKEFRFRGTGYVDLTMIQKNGNFLY